MSTSNNRYNNEIQLTWKDEESKTCKIQKLSAEKLQKLMAPKSNKLEDITALSLSNRQMAQIDNLSGLRKLARLDISKNSLARLQHFNSIPQVTLLNASQNDLNSDAALEELRYLTALRTLNIGLNPRLKHIRSHIMKPMGTLQVLIANDCGISKAGFLKFLPNLNTLVLSHNKLTTFTFDEVGSLRHMVKCSLGHNEFTQVPDFTAICSAASDPTGSRRARENVDFYDNCLEELRLNGNRIASVPATITRNKKLKTLDLSSNLIANWDDVKTLAELPSLTNLSLHNNRLEVLDEAPAGAGGGATHGPNAAPLASYVNSLKLREDISAEAVRARDPSGRESLLRKYTLCLFQRTVGKEAKLHVQLVVLDMRRVKDKWTHANDAEGEAPVAGKKAGRERSGHRDQEQQEQRQDRGGGSSSSKGAKDHGSDRGKDRRAEKQVPRGERADVNNRDAPDQPRKKQRVADAGASAGAGAAGPAKPPVRSAGILSSDDTLAVQRAHAHAAHPEEAERADKAKKDAASSSQYTGVKAVQVFGAATVNISIKSPGKSKKPVPIDEPSVLAAVTSASVDVGTGSGSGWD
jgi:Leucine-rich repeat (LRR) protein